MYEAFYGFSEDPFRISPDYRFSYPHRSYLKAKNYLEYGLLRAEGIVVVTGEPGTGKSTVINDLLSDYDSNELVVAKLLTTQIDSNDLLRMLAYSFGLDALSMDKATVLTHLEHYLNELFESGQRALLIVDEAQNLSIDSLEELRLLSNLQQYEHPLLQIFLIGQPKLQELIRSPSLEQLRQRLVAACHFEALSSEETQQYIEHRLNVVGWQQDPRFTNEAFKQIHRFSGGIPRRVNLICNRLLLHGHVESLHELGASDVQQVIEELPPEMTIDGEAKGFSRLSAAAASSPGRRTLVEGDSRQTPLEVQSEDTVRLYPREIPESRTAPDMTIPPGGDKPSVAMHPNAHKAGQASTSRIPKSIPQRQRSDTDPLFSLTATRPLPSSNETGERRAGASTAATIQREHPRSQSFPPKRALPPAHIGLKQRLSRPRSWMRPIAAGLTFIAAFGISYGYLRLNPGKYLYSSGASFQSEDPVTKRKDPPGGTDVSAPKDNSDTYVYAQEETSSDLLNLTLGSLLPGPENIQDIGISKPMGNDPPSSLRLQDAENALRNIQNQERQQHLLEEQSTQIIEEVIGVDSELENKILSDPPLQHIDKAKAPFKQDEKPSKQANDNLASKDAGVESKRGRLVINRELENALRHYTPAVQRLSSGSLKITLNSHLAFQPDSAHLNGNASRMLDKLAFVMRNYDGFRIQIVAEKSNGGKGQIQTEVLPEQRVKMIASHLIDHGISARRVQSGEYAEFPPASASASINPSNDRITDKIGIYLKPEA